MPATRLLVMDDEADFCEIVRISATSHGYDVTVLTDPMEFKAVCHHLKPDIIVLDIVMPNIDGVELLRWLGEQESGAKIIVITGYNQHYAEMAGKIWAQYGLGPIQTLMKPVRERDLRAALSRHSAK
ncbi:MAG: response regulator [Alphaproteobacteria bacterium]